MKNELMHTLNKKEAIEAIIGLGEVGLDSFLKSGIGKDIPIIGTLVKLSEFGLNISDYMFIKKLQKFCSQLSKESDEQRESFFEKINSNPKLQEKVNENLLLLISASDDIDKPTLIGKIFGSYLKQEITYDLFMKFSTSVNRMNSSQFSILRSLNSIQIPIEAGNIMASHGMAIISIPTTAGSSSPEYFLNEDGKSLVLILFGNVIDT